MKAVILAAGLGMRLQPRTDELPKALIEIAERPLLEYSLTALKMNGLKEVVIVIGFHGDLIRKEFGERYKGLKISYIANNAYAQTGSMYSFLCAKDIITEDVILLESDLLYDPRAIRLMLESNYENCMLVSDKSGSGDEVYICVDSSKKIIKLGKGLTEENRKKAIGEMVGISKFSRKFITTVFNRAEEDYKKGDLKYHHEECVFLQSQSGEPVYSVFDSNLAWTEIDNEDDLKRACTQIYPRIKQNTLNKGKVDYISKEICIEER